MWLQAQGHIGRSDSEATQRASRENSLPVWCSHLSHLERPKRKKYLYASTQVEQNPVLWLVTRAGNMELSCPLMITRCAPQEKFPPEPYKKAFIDLASLVFFFARVYGPGRETTKKRTCCILCFLLWFLLLHFPIHTNQTGNCNLPLVLEQFSGQLSTNKNKKIRRLSKKTSR